MHPRESTLGEARTGGVTNASHLLNGAEILGLIRNKLHGGIIVPYHSTRL